MNGLGYTWNPGKPVVERLDKGEWRTIELLPNEGFIPAREATLAADGSERIRKPSTFANLLRPQLWLAAAGQIFFSLSVGFGVIITYASYLREKDDVVLSGLTATSTNEFCEVGLGGLMTLPAAFVFLGSAGMAGLSGFGIGFVVLPQVFATMHAGALFGFLFFFLLFLAAVTSSLSMLQPGIAFIEEALGVGRKVSLAILGLVTAIGTLFVWYFSENTKALDTIDFWVGTALIYVQGTILIILFSWVVGVDRGIEEAHKGAAIRIPGWFRPIMKFVCPVFLLVILFAWLTLDVLGWNGSVASAAFDPSAPIKDLIGTTDHPASGVARLSVAGIIVVTAFFLFLIQLGGKRWDGVQKPGGAS
jgi:SNF family Na+-dependent transporter